MQQLKSSCEKNTEIAGCEKTTIFGGQHVDEKTNFSCNVEAKGSARFLSLNKL